MNPHALAVLELDAVLERVALRAASPAGRERILSLRPGTERDALRAELERVAETLRHVEAHPRWSPPAFPDASSALRTLEPEGSVLSPAELHDLLGLLAASRELHGALPLGGESEASPHLERLRDRLPVREELEEGLSRIVDDEGAVRDDASPALRGIRSSLRTARGRIVRELERFLAGLPERFRVEGASVSVREGRYVIPIRREGKGEVGGVVHGESATGATLFVEPPLAIRLMNELHEMEREEAKEVQRILRDATGRLRPLREELAAAFDAHVDFDTLHARALAARDWGAEAPELLGPDAGELEIVEGRHPLLVEQGIEVVPFFLRLYPDERVLVVSGPNTGGKTVFLKAMGLIHVLAQSGVLPPVAAGTRLPIVEDVFADIGDEQSIAASLSTFSAHLARAREILEGAGPRSLVLMDELGTGTDPAEGAALARAILETLVERGARAVVTSHLGALKRLDAEGSGIVNASLRFDSRRIAPTYQLEKGRPGRSYGLAVARRLGLPGEVLDRAQAYVDPAEARMEGLLETLERKERELTAALERAEAAVEEARRLREDAETRRAQVEERERTAEVRAREQARRLLLEAREEVEAAIREVRSAATEGAEAERRARRRVEEAVRAHGERVPRRAPRERRRKSAPVAEGDLVRLVGSGARGVVRELREDRVTVEVGGLRLRLPRGEVEPVGDRAAAGRPAPAAGRSERVPAAAPAGARGAWSGPDVEVRLEADLRGLRVDEVELELGRALDGAVVGNLSELRIIHGKGTGAVKARVQELLRHDQRVKEFRPGGEGEGGAGVTVAVLA